MKHITDKSTYLWALKWLPVIGTALIASHYAMLPFGYKSFIIDYITDVSLFAWVYLYFASKLFFCRCYASLHPSCLLMHRSGHRYACSPPINYMISYGKESKTSTAEDAGDGSWPIQASTEIRRVSELLMATNGRRARTPNTRL